MNRAERRALKFGAPKTAPKVQAPPGFRGPTDVTDADMAFGGRDMEKLLPAYEQIPDEFKHMSSPWVQLQQRWFFTGLPKETEFAAKAGIDGKAALRHCAAIQRSFAPKHEHKEAGVAYLLSLWFDDVRLGGQSLVRS